jgi:spermidine/putrescine transport system permease protein
VSAQAEVLPSARARGLRLGTLSLSLPAVAALVLLFVVPLGFFAFYSILTAGLYTATEPLTLDNYREALTSSLNHTLAINSLTVGLATAAITVTVGLAVAYWLRFCAGRWQSLVLFLVVASMFASYLVRIYAWRTILGDNGILNRGLHELGITSRPLGFLIFSRTAVVIALVHILLPYVVLLLYASLRSLSVEQLESGQDLGANALQRWRRIVLPFVAAPAVSAFLFVFVLSAGDFVTPQFLGGTNGSMLGVRVQTSFIETGNWPLGAAIGFLMLAGFALAYTTALAGLHVATRSRSRRA